MTNRIDHKAKILLVEEDDDTRPLLKEMLQKSGYRLTVALDEEDALERLRGGDAGADLILVNMIDVTTNEALDAARRIQGETKSGDATSIVVMAENYGEELEGKDVQVGIREYVTYPEDFRQLENLLARLLHKHVAPV